METFFIKGLGSILIGYWSPSQWNIPNGIKRAGNGGGGKGMGESGAVQRLGSRIKGTQQKHHHTGRDGQAGLEKADRGDRALLEHRATSRHSTSHLPRHRKNKKCTWPTQSIHVK